MAQHHALLLHDECSSHVDAHSQCHYKVLVSSFVSPRNQRKTEKKKRIIPRTELKRFSWINQEVRNFGPQLLVQENSVQLRINECVSHYLQKCL